MKLQTKIVAFIRMLFWGETEVICNARYNCKNAKHCKDILRFKCENYEPIRQ